MAGQLVECKTCENIGVSELRGSFWISFVLFWFVMMFPGIIYMIWRRGGLGVCKFCGSNNVIPYHGSRTKLVDKNTLLTPILKEEITCPFCKEEIKSDAIKCKHCGSLLG